MNLFYAIVGEDTPDSLERRLAARPAHIERLQALQAAGRLLLAGPFPAIDSPDPGPAGFSGSLIVAAFDSLEAARAWADADPYVASGVYSRVDVKPFKRVFSSMNPLADLIRDRLAELAPLQLDINDESARHAGHAGSGGGGHFHIRIVAGRFTGMNTLARHRLVYACLADLIPERIHALSITALAPESP